MFSSQVGFKPVRKWFVIPTMFGPLLHQYARLARSCIAVALGVHNYVRCLFHYSIGHSAL